MIIFSLYERFGKNHRLAQVCLMIGTVPRVINVAQLPFGYFQSIGLQEAVAVWAQELHSISDFVGTWLEIFYVGRFDFKPFFINIRLD